MVEPEVVELIVSGGDEIDLVETNDDQEFQLVEFGFQVIGLPANGGNVGGLPDAVEINATEDIPALALITAGGEIANSNNTAHFNHVVGIVMEATADGMVADAVVEGEVTATGWSWTANQKLFLNGSGLSTTPPSSGFSQLVGITRNSQTIFIRLQVPILL